MRPLTDDRHGRGWWYCTWCAGWKPPTDPAPESPDGKDWRCAVCSPRQEDRSMKVNELTPAFCRERTMKTFKTDVAGLAKLIAAGMEMGINNAAPPDLLHRWMLKVSEMFPDDGWWLCTWCASWLRPDDPPLKTHGGRYTECRACAARDVANAAVSHPGRGEYYCEFCESFKAGPAHRTPYQVGACEDCARKVGTV